MNIDKEFHKVISRSASIEDLKGLLDRGADVHAQNEFGDTPLMLACSAGKEDVIVLLLQYGANPLTVNPDGQTALTLYLAFKERAASYGFFDDGEDRIPQLLEQAMLDQVADNPIADQDMVTL